MANAGNDPVALWHNMLGEMEKGFNAFANQAMASPEFSKVVNQVGGVSAGAQKQLGDMMEKYLTSMNLPSRAQMTNFGERLAAIEGQLAEITTLLRLSHPTPAEHAAPAQHATPAESVVPPAPKPPRTKRPPEPARK